MLCNGIFVDNIDSLELSVNPAQQLLQTLHSAVHFIVFHPVHDLVLLRQNVGGKVLGHRVARERLEDALVEGAECGLDPDAVLDHDS